MPASAVSANGIVRRFREEGREAVYGDAGHKDTLKASGVAIAGFLVLSSSGLRNAEEIIRLARELNPTVEVLARALDLREQSALRKAGADVVVSGEGEVALSMTEAVLTRLSRERPDLLASYTAVTKARYTRWYNHPTTTALLRRGMDCPLEGTSMYLVLAIALNVVSQPAPEPKAPLRQGRYAAYWLTKVGDRGEYRKLLVTRAPLSELPRLVELQAPPEEAWKRGQPPPQVLEYPALMLTTYKKDSVWNDGVPIRPLTRFKGLDEKEKTVEVNGARHAYEECPLPDLARILKDPMGKERIARIHSPLGGMEQTARALRLLVEEQIREERKK